MKNVKNLVMKFNPNEDQIFVDYKNKMIPPLVDTDWEELKRDQSSDFSLMVMDLKTMNYINMDGLQVQEGKLVNTRLHDVI